MDIIGIIIAGVVVFFAIKSSVEKQKKAQNSSQSKSEPFEEENTSLTKTTPSQEKRVITPITTRESSETPNRSVITPVTTKTTPTQQDKRVITPITSAQSQSTVRTTTNANEERLKQLQELRAKRAALIAAQTQKQSGESATIGGLSVSAVSNAEILREQERRAYEIKRAEEEKKRRESAGKVGAITQPQVKPKHTHGGAERAKVEKVYVESTSEGIYANEGCDEHYGVRFVSDYDYGEEEDVQLNVLEKLMVFGELVAQPKFLQY